MHTLPRNSAGRTLFLFFASFRRSKSALCNLLCEATCSLRTDKQLGNVTSVVEYSKIVTAQQLGPVHTSHFCLVECNRPRSIYQYSNMAPRLSGQTSIFGVVFFVFESLLGIGHVRYINILTWLRGFQVKPLYLVSFSLYLSLFWELKDNGNLKNLQFSPESLGAMLEY